MAPQSGQVFVASTTLSPAHTGASAMWTRSRKPPTRVTEAAAAATARPRTDPSDSPTTGVLPVFPPDHPAPAAPEADASAGESRTFVVGAALALPPTSRWWDDSAGTAGAAAGPISGTPHVRRCRPLYLKRGRSQCIATTRTGRLPS